MGGYLISFAKDLLTEYNTRYDEGRQAQAQASAKRAEATNAAMAKKQELINDITKTMITSENPYVNTDGVSFPEYVANLGGIAKFYETNPNEVFNSLMTFSQQTPEGEPKIDPKREKMLEIIQNINNQISGEKVSHYEMPIAGLPEDFDTTGFKGDTIRFGQLKASPWFTKNVKENYSLVSNLALQFSAVNAEDPKDDENKDNKEQTLIELNNGTPITFYSDPAKSGSKDQYNTLANIAGALIKNKKEEDLLLPQNVASIGEQLNSFHSKLMGALTIEAGETTIEVPELRFNDLAAQLTDAGLNAYADMFTDLDNKTVIKISEHNINVNKLKDEKIEIKSIDQIIKTVDADGVEYDSYIPPELEAEYAPLAKILGYDTVKAMYIANGSPHDPNNEILSLANLIVQHPGFLVQNDLGQVVSAFKNESFHGISSNLQKSLGSMLAIANGSTANKILALQIAINDNTKKSSSGTKVQTSKILPLPQSVIDTINDKTGDKGLAELKDKIRLGNELESLLNDFIMPVVTGEVRTGFAGDVELFIENLVGDEGQIEQLMSYFTGTDTNIDPNIIMWEDFKDEEGASGLEYIKAYVKRHNNKGYAYGKQAALRIFIAYKMAKYFDPSGRVSDRDLQNQLDAFAGTALSGRLTVAGQATVALKRVTNELELLKSLNYEKDKITPKTIKRLEAGSIYFGIVGTKENMLAQRVKGWEYDKEQYDLKPHVVLDNQMYHDNKPVYKVFSKIKTENKQGEERPYATFGQYGGLYVTQDDSGEWKPLDIRNTPTTLKEVKEDSAGQAGKSVLPTNQKHDGKWIYEVDTKDGPIKVYGNSVEEVEKMTDYTASIVPDNILKDLGLIE